MPRRAVTPDRAVRLARVEKPNLEGLHDYQKQGALWLRARKNALLGDDMGVGKTVQALRALPQRARAIVCCPASVVLTWQAEAKKWRPDFLVTTGEALRRPDEGEILVISYDSLPELRPGTARLTDEPMRDVFLVLDECQMVKSGEALRSKKVRRLRVQCGTCWGLSATPMLGSPEDLWGVLVSLGLSHIYGDREAFIDLCEGKIRWIWDKKMNAGRGGRRRAGYEWGKVSPEVQERLREVMLRRLADEVLENLPAQQNIDVPVPSPADLKPFLDRVKEAWDNVGPSDLPPFELLSEAMAALARAKIPAALEFADNAADAAPLLVFSAHVDPVLAMRKLKGAGAFVGEESLSERKKLVEKFMGGELRLLAMTIKTGGTGLNLQQAGGVLFVDRDYTPGANLQALARARRQGNVRACVRSWRLISDHPLDRNLSRILDEKQRLISAAVG